MGDQKGGMTQISGMMHDTADTMMSMPGEMGKQVDAMRKDAAPGTSAKKPGQHSHPRDGK